METKSGKNKTQIMLLLLPGILIFAIFTIYPIINLLIMSFSNWEFSSLTKPTFAGIVNYKNVLCDSQFWVSFTNTVVYTVITVPGQMIIGLLVAVLLCAIPKLKVTYRVLYYIPVITSWVIVSLVFKYIFNTEGMLNYLLVNILHVANSNIAWLDSRWGGMSVAMMLGIWKGIGWNMVIFLAALQSIPEELYEASSIDGCSNIKKFFYITLPSIKTTILFALIMLTIGGFNVFTSIKMITNGQPMHQTDTVLTWMYFTSFSEGKLGYGAALSFIVAIVLGIISIAYFRMFKNKETN